MSNDGSSPRLRLAEPGEAHNRSGGPGPLPLDAPLLALEDVARYLRITPAAVRRLVDGRADGSDGELGDRLRGWLVKLSPRRRYIRREPFLTWLREIPGDRSSSGPAR